MSNQLNRIDKRKPRHTDRGWMAGSFANRTDLLPAGDLGFGSYSRHSGERGCEFFLSQGRFDCLQFAGGRNGSDYSDTKHWRIAGILQSILSPILFAGKRAAKSGPAKALNNVRIFPVFFQIQE